MAMEVASSLTSALVASALVALLALAVGLLLWRRVRDLERELGRKTGREEVQNLLLVSRLLEDPETREAERGLVVSPPSPDLKQWQEAQREQALHLCSRYGLLGGLIRQGLLREEEGLWRWGERAVQVYRAVAPLVLARQAEEPGFSADFQWLCARSRRLQAEREVAGGRRVRIGRKRRFGSGPHRIA